MVKRRSSFVRRPRTRSRSSSGGGSYPTFNNSATTIKFPCGSDGFNMGEASNRPDVEKYEYCNPVTNTKWLRVCSYTANDAGVVTESILSDTDTGFPCVEGEINKIETICGCDNINNDLTEIVNYTTAYKISVTAAGVVETVNLGTFTDDTLSQPYTPISPIDCSSIGEPAMIREFVMCDDGNTFIRVMDMLSGTIVRNIDPMGNTYIPTGQASFGSCNMGVNKLDITCMVDTVGSDIIPFVRVCYVSVSETGEVVTSSVGDFTDETMKTPYTVIGVAQVSNEVGDAVETKQGREVVENGFVWSPSLLTTCYTIRVSSIGDINNPPTYTDSFGNTTTLEQGEVVSYSTKNEILDSSPFVTTFTGDRVVITSVSLGSVN